MFKDEEGFSLLELVVAVGVAGVIAAIAMPTFNNLITDSKNKSDTAASSFSSNALNAENILDSIGAGTGGGGVAESSSSSVGPIVRTFDANMIVSNIYSTSTNLSLYQMFSFNDVPMLQQGASATISWLTVSGATGYKLYYITDYNNPSGTLIDTQTVSSSAADVPTNVLNTVAANNAASIYYGSGFNVFVQIVPYNSTSYGDAYTVELNYQMNSRWMTNSIEFVDAWYLDSYTWDMLNMWYVWNPVLDFNCQPLQPNQTSYVATNMMNPNICYNPNAYNMLFSIGAWYQGQNMVPTMTPGSTQDLTPYNYGNTYSYPAASLWSN